MKLYYDNKACDDQARYPACRPYPYRRYCNYGYDYGRDCDHGKDYDRDCDYDKKGKDYDRDYDYDRKRKDCDKDHDYEKKCRCECVEYEECNEKHEYKHCKPKNPCPYPVLFECAQGTGARVERTIIGGQGQGNNGTTNFFYPRSLGCLTIDTTCLKNPVVKFDFCSIIHYFSGGNDTVPVRLVFGLFKTCDEGQEVPCGTWDFTVALDVEDEQLTTSFNFCYCECNSCPGCCKYSVRLVEAVNVNEDDVADICNVTLSAIAKSGC